MACKDLPKLLICPGFIKAGTTWLYEILKLSSQVSVPTNKELHFFSYGTGRNLPDKLRSSVTRSGLPQSRAEYLHNFDLGRSLICDISPSYLGWPTFIPSIAEADFDTYFVVVTRDKVARIASSWLHATRVGLENESLMKAVYRDYRKKDLRELPLRKYYQLSDYQFHVNQLENEFGAEKVITIDVDTATQDSICERISELTNTPITIPTTDQAAPLEQHRAKYIGKKQYLIKALLRREGFAGFISRNLPKSQKFRRALYKTVYRGSPSDSPISESELGELKEFVKSEFPDA